MSYETEMVTLPPMQVVVSQQNPSESWEVLLPDYTVPLSLLEGDYDRLIEHIAVHVIRELGLHNRKWLPVVNVLVNRLSIVDGSVCVTGQRQTDIHTSTFKPPSLSASLEAFKSQAAKLSRDVPNARLAGVLLGLAWDRSIARGYAAVLSELERILADVGYNEPPVIECES